MHANCDYEASLWLERHFIHESEMALFLECRQSCACIVLDTADIVIALESLEEEEPKMRW